MMMRNSARCINRSRSSIWTWKNRVQWNAWIRVQRNYWMRVWWHAWIIILNIFWCRYMTQPWGMFWFFSSPPSWNIFLREPCMYNVYYIMIIWRKVVGMIPMYTSLVTSLIIMDNLSIIVKVRVDSILRRKSTSFIITPTITSFVFTRNSMNTTRRNR